MKQEIEHKPNMKYLAVYLIMTILTNRMLPDTSFGEWVILGAINCVIWGILTGMVFPMAVPKAESTKEGDEKNGNS